MALTHFKAVLAAVLELPPTKPTFHKSTPWRDRVSDLRRYCAALVRWKRIGKALDGQHVPYREVRNAPSTMRGMPGMGTLRAPSISTGGRITDCAIVHTRPNHAARRRAGELGPQRTAEIERRQDDIRQARLAVANGTWGQHQAEHFLEAA